MLVSLAACSGADPASALMSKQRPELGSESKSLRLVQDCDAGWNKIDASGAFAFCLPGDMQKQPGTGIDSYAEEYWNQQIHFSFDYGMYSDSLEYYSSNPQYREEQIEISGKPAKLISFVESGDTFGYKTAVYWKDVGAGEQTHLGMRAHCQTEQDRDVGRKILLSTELPTTN